MKQFGKILKFELKNYAKNKAFVGVTIFLMVVIAIVMFFPRITALFQSDDSSNTTADISVMLVKADDPTQADMVKETFAASFTDYDVQITDEEISHFDHIYQGVDWGYYPDSYCFVRLHYDRARETIFLIDEYYANKKSNTETADWIKQKGYTDAYIICDSAEPKSIADYRAMGLPAKAAVKGPGSVDYGMKFLQKRKIVIDRNRTPNAYREFVGYEYERSKDGDIISGYPDADNHSIDSVRYSLEWAYRRMGVIA